MERMFRCVWLGSRVGLGAMESSCYQECGRSQEVSLSPVCRLVGAALECGIPPESLIQVFRAWKR